MSCQAGSFLLVVFSDDTRIAVRMLNACSHDDMSEIVLDLFEVLAEVTPITWSLIMVKCSGLLSPSKSAKLTYSHFLSWSTNWEYTGGIPTITTTIGDLRMFTACCAAEVSVRLIGVEANVVLRDMGVVMLRE